MKPERGQFTQVRRDRLPKELVHDSYKSKRKLPEPTRCPDCGAIYHEGRWRWDEAAKDAHAERCPACHRVHDQFPAGYVALRDEFLGAHRDDIVGRVRSCAETEAREHPLERIMKIEDDAEGMLVTTTDTHLARRIGEALHDAYKGELEFHYNKEENLLRVHWTR